MNTTNYWTKTSTNAARASLLLAAILALVPSLMKAQCAQGWDVSGQWHMNQGTLPIAMNLQQSGTTISGTASYHLETKGKKGVLGIGGRYGGVGDYHGSVQGTVSGNTFNVEIAWDNQTTGVYSGTIGPQGKIEGNTHDKAKPSSKANWSSDRNMICKPPKF